MYTPLFTPKPPKSKKNKEKPREKNQKKAVDRHAQEQGSLMRTMLKRLQESCRAKLVKSRRRLRPKLRAKETKLQTLFFVLYSFLPRLRSCAAVAGSIFGSVMSVWTYAAGVGAGALKFGDIQDMRVKNVKHPFIF
jgi:hypothetical protein